MNSIRWRWLVVAGVTLLAAFLLYPSVNWYTLSPQERQSREDLRERPKSLLNLGLDLRGGTHLLMAVDVNKAIENALDRAAADLTREAAEAKIALASAVRKNSRIEVSLNNSADRTQFTDLVKQRFPNLSIESSKAQDGRVTFQLATNAREEKRLRDFTVEQSLETIRNRIDQFGVAEPIIRRQGEQDIVVQLPGIQDPQRAKELIGRTAVLEFKMLAEVPDGEDIIAGKRPAPPGTQILNGVAAEHSTGRARYLVQSQTLMTGDTIADALVRPATQMEGPYVAIELNARGAKLFDDLTARNVGKRMAIILDNSVYSAPVIRERISGGRASITGNFSVNEARDLAIVLRAGALPAPVNVIEERTIGPTVGEDSIKAGLAATVLAALFIFAFMFFYYSVAGLVADLALILNLMILLALMAYFGFTLTLPGIAGIVLTMAITVDDNVLIFERIREELALRKSVRTALASGYERAWTAIRDSLIATGISSIFLFQFGSGPIRGFAVTLLLGMLVGRFTSINVTRLVFETYLANPRVNTIRIG
ncbi:MAG TPA: protein translocase subunit SecD [Candidatus Margulisiibacteriota bacterium]|nr:protein translocase subunit SecD [Candidatus Margulisiibacteriota bacterium]